MGMSRRQLREHIFKLLFNLDFYAQDENDGQLALYFTELTGDQPDIETLTPGETWYTMRFQNEEDSDIPEYATPQERAYISDKVLGVYRELSVIDDAIGRASKGWKVTRMPKADLAILRLAVYEIRFDEKIPDKVAVNEAVELAKRYGNEDSPVFINGVLSRFVAS